MELFETDKNVDAKEFLTCAGSIVITKKNYPVSTTLIIQVQQISVNHLGVKDLFQLRDRFEGQAYMDNLLLKVSALYIIEKETSQSLIDWNIIKWDKKADFTLITLKNKKYRVIPFFYGTLPILSSVIQEPIIFCAIRSDFKNGIICGVLEGFNFDDQLLFTTKQSSSKRKLKKFIGFKYLKSLEAETSVK